MKYLKYLTQKLVILVIVLWTLWLIVTQIFERLDQRLPLFLALFLTYLIAAYLILPKVVHFTILITRRGHIPRFTLASDGLTVDPVNLIFFGDKKQLFETFEKIEWKKADKITTKSVIKLIRAFLFNKYYPTAPFSYLYLFGRKQDFGFQKNITKNPKERHHVRFWGVDLENLVDPFDFNYWYKRRKIDLNKANAWIGAVSKDVGLKFKPLTYQVTHKVDYDVDQEREYLLSILKKENLIREIKYYDPEEFKKGKYISDGKIATAKF